MSFGGPQRNEAIFAPSSNMFCLLTAIYWSAGDDFLEYYWRVLCSDFEEVFIVNMISPLCFNLRRWENGKCRYSYLDLF
jgi:hypothetical protein